MVPGIPVVAIVPGPLLLPPEELLPHRRLVFNVPTTGIAAIIVTTVVSIIRQGAGARARAGVRAAPATAVTATAIAAIVPAPAPARSPSSSTGTSTSAFSAATLVLAAAARRRRVLPALFALSPAPQKAIP